MAQRGRCPGECGFEAAVSQVVTHMRGCALYAQRFLDDSASGSLDPVEVYRAAHVADVPAAGKRGRGSKSTSGFASSESSTAVAVEYWEWSPTLLESVSTTA